MLDTSLPRYPKGAVIAFAVLAVAACGERQPKEYRPTASIERPATEYETRRVLLEGPRTLFESDLDDGRSEWFTSEGHYDRTGGVTLSGRYEVRGNRVCTSVSLETPLDNCRSLVIAPDGPRFIYLPQDLAR
ncbi:hypothetical protein [Brevundimonas sp. M20]|uniref:hypothetical protein n=1 Tax=Brevundimonas sp. M20 TaxID=2591463 RepID=UPI00114634BA|nr:hypothetical protein [Brevundimonas sp. M20]QDH72844.1 hypothetical protein FKQ52_05055 [Brevundimonas sp. M20]